MIPVELIVKSAGAIALALVLYLGYAQVKSIGYKEAEAVYQEKIAVYEKTLLIKINNIESLSNTLALESRENSEVLARDIEDILKKVKGKPLVIVKDGECTPSANFSNSIGALNQRANQAIKESQK